MIKWNPDAKENKDLEQNWAKYFHPSLRKGQARILKNRYSKVEELTTQLFSEVKCCDVIFAYQARKGKLHGFCTVTETHFQHGHRWIGFLPVYALEVPVNLLRLKRKNEDIKKLECLQPSLPRTLYKLSKSDYDLILSLCPDDVKSKITAGVKACINGKAINNPDGI